MAITLAFSVIADILGQLGVPHVVTATFELNKSKALIAPLPLFFVGGIDELL